MIYAPTDVRAITVPAGCGVPHEAGYLAEGERWNLDCPACEPAIIAMRTGWAHTPAGVALTPDEIGVAEAEEQAAARHRNRTWGDPTAVGQALAQALTTASPAPAATAPVPSLLEQIAALSLDERRALGLMLMEPVADEMATLPAPSIAAPAVEGAESAPVVRRGPGRPRKTVEA